MSSDLQVELSETSDDELIERFRTLELQRRSIEAEMAAIVREGERRAIETVDGHRSMKHWVRAQTNCPASEAAKLCRLSRAASDLPDIGDALRSGHIGVAQANELARVHSNPRCGDQLGSVAALLLQHAEHLSFEEFRVVTKRWETLADLDGAQRNDDLSHERRTAGVFESNGALDMRATGGSGAATAELMAIFDRYVQSEFEADVAARTEMFGADAPASALPRTDPQRRFDALAAIFRAAVIAPADGIAPEPVVNLVVGLDTYETLLERREASPAAVSSDPLDRPVDTRVERMESSNGIPVAPDDVIAATLTGYVRRVVIDSAGVVVNAGRKRRLFTGVAREMALLLSQGCAHVGCTVAADRCEVDHLQEWASDDGRTDQENGQPRCSSHNPWKSRHRSRTTRSPDGYIVDWRADGTPMTPVGRRVEPPDRRDRVDRLATDPISTDRRHAAAWGRRTFVTEYCRLRSARGHDEFLDHLRSAIISS